MTRSMTLAAMALALSGCAGFPGAGGDSRSAQDLLAKFLSDPACAHDDKISVVTGAAGLPASVQASAERHCPAARPAAEAAPAAP